jgi:hypothetical protein
LKWLWLQGFPKPDTRPYGLICAHQVICKTSESHLN